ncbi:hypothetical protein MOUN0_M01772 [Monosporozyma unispora]
MTITKPNHPIHILHFIPAKINSDCSTTELANELFNETPEEDYTTIYLRGRKLKGKPVLVESLIPCLIQKTEIEEQNDSNSTIINNDDILTLTSIINYEREGNEERLDKEHERFHEFMDITNLIHEH